ncbi:DUF6010 family protein [Roseovarius pelagicus]|uniref:Uncharacterized protein n=1 Tax=Roseovarius pelagicus TaxID=2980108 RepID=A0ABY6DGI2_9RHOB|nr:DUF6010 family protein [Roseovarius pelagicus]UXX85257.1 hypothetical protein N7U68_20650 [Roseovarius pelagicus]
MTFHLLEPLEMEGIEHETGWARKARSMSNAGSQTKRLVTTKLGPSAVVAGLFIIFALIHLWVTEEALVTIAALTLALIGGAYIGFGASTRSMATFCLELGGAVFYAVVALAGLLWIPLALTLGLAAHAVWDLLHHNSAFGAPVPDWYVPLCVSCDLLAAEFLFGLYLP